jgi:predicted metal-dependent phosphoesterase TrpH
MVLDLHVHSELSDDSRAGVATYMKVLRRKREERPLDGLVLTEHRQWNADLDYRALEDEYGMRILRGAEVETDYGHILVYGVNDDITARFDFADIRLSGQEVIREVDRLGGVAVPCHPGRTNIGLTAHYETKPPLEGIVAVEAINGGSRGDEDACTAKLMDAHGYAGFGGSDSHLVAFVGLCATRFEDEIADEEALVRALKAGRCEPVDFR